MASKALKESFPPISLKNFIYSDLLNEKLWHDQIHASARMYNTLILEIWQIVQMETYCKNMKAIMTTVAGEYRNNSKRGFCLGDDAACVFLRFQIRFLHWFHLLFLGFCLHKTQRKQQWNTMLCYKIQTWVTTENELRDLVIFGTLGQVKGAIHLWRALLAEGRQLESNWLHQAITGLQLQQRWLHWDFVEISEEIYAESYSYTVTFQRFKQQLRNQ